MKSAYELAMSRLEKSTPTQPLTARQKELIAEVDSEITARIAEKKIFLEGELAKASDSQTQDELRRQLSSEISRLEEKREEKKEKIRHGASSSI